MGRNSNLAGLAALGALGYMMSKDKDQASTDQTPGPGRQSQGAGYDSFGTNTGAAQTGIADADTNQSVLKAMQSTPVSSAEAPNPTAGNQGVLSSKSSAPKVSSPKSRKNPNYSNEGRGSVVPDYSNEGRAGVGPDMSGKPQAGNRNPRTGRPMPFSDTAPTSTRTARPLPPGARFVPGFGAVDENDNIIPGYMGGYNPDEAASGTSSRNPRTGRQMTTFKKGGAVKMASGGATSSASRRADGIATKGKTRGKIC